MSRNSFDASCQKCETPFRFWIGDPIKCPECGFVASASPEPMRIRGEREGTKGSTELPATQIIFSQGK